MSIRNSALSVRYRVLVVGTEGPTVADLGRPRSHEEIGLHAVRTVAYNRRTKTVCVCLLYLCLAIRCRVPCIRGIRNSVCIICTFIWQTVEGHETVRVSYIPLFGEYSMDIKSVCILYTVIWRCAAAWRLIDGRVQCVSADRYV